MHKVARQLDEVTVSRLNIQVHCANCACTKWVLNSKGPQQSGIQILSHFFSEIQIFEFFFSNDLRYCWIEMYHGSDQHLRLWCLWFIVGRYDLVLEQIVSRVFMLLTARTAARDRCPQ